MQTYKPFTMLLACTLLCCSKSDQDQGSGEETVSGVQVDYTMILEHNGQWSGSLINADLEHVFLDNGGSSFNPTEVSELTYREGTTFSQFIKDSDGKGEIAYYDFGAGQEETIDVFEDFGICTLEPKAIAHSPTKLFMAFGLWNEVTLKNDYFIRTIDRKTEEVKDIPVDKEPSQLAFSNNRLFALCLDAKGTGIYSLVVVDANAGNQIHEISLGLDAQKIAINSEGNILVSFAGMHTIIDSSMLKSISEVRYNAGKDPKFGSLTEGVFNDGKLYYRRPKEISGSITQIPAVYDFAGNVATYYYYENFLTEAQLQFEYNIEDTSMVSYDAKNNLILIGYRKAGNAQLGGLLRIKPAPDPKIIDNTNLDGIPYAIFVN